MAECCKVFRRQPNFSYWVRYFLKTIRWFEVLAAKGATVSDANHYPRIDHSDEFDAWVIAFLTGALGDRR